MFMYILYFGRIMSYVIPVVIAAMALLMVVALIDHLINEYTDHRGIHDLVFDGLKRRH